MGSPHKQLELFLAASKLGLCETVEEIITCTDPKSKQFVDINHKSSTGKTALHIAIEAHQIHVVQTLLHHGAEIEKSSFCSYNRDNSGVQLVSCDEPPLVTAARFGNTQIIKLLLEAGASPDRQSVCHTQSSSTSIPDRTALHFAVETLNVEGVQLLLNANADVNVVDKQGEMAIHQAVRCRQCKPQTIILAMLCEHGADIDLENRIGCTPLYLATFYNCLEKVNLLLVCGAKPDSLCTRSTSYGSPLHIAAAKDRPELALIFIKNGSLLDIRNQVGATPLSLNIGVLGKSSLAGLLISHGADMSGRDRFNYTLLAQCIRNMRLDCETLVPHMLYAGYELNGEMWLNPPWAKRMIKPTSSNGNRNDINQPDSPNQIGDQNRLQNGQDLENTEDFPEVPIAPGRVETLCAWLRNKQTNPLKLVNLCRIRVRKLLSQHTCSRSVLPAVQTLPLPPTLLDFLAMKEFTSSDAQRDE